MMSNTFQLRNYWREDTDEVVKMKEMDVKKPMGPECVRMDHEGMC